MLHNQVALALPALLDWPVDIVHCHDAEAAPALLYRRQWYADRDLPGPGATILTIHNLAHQEVHGTSPHRHPRTAAFDGPPTPGCWSSMAN